MAVNRLYYGSPEPLPPRRWLRAGPLEVAYEQGELRYLRLGGREIVRRLYVAVRDRDWGTVPLTLSDERVEAAEHGFRVAFLASHRQGEIDFRWRGTIEGEADGTIRFEMDGQAHATFLRNRIGFCVLHPIRECAGRPCWVEHSDGSREEGVFPREIAPHQPFRDMRAIGYEVVDGLEAELRFEGDVFEMEDQRNWTDASFKTYCTPLSQPYPVEVQEGQAVRQVVWLFLGGVVERGADERPELPTLTIGDQPVGRLPLIGVATTEGELLSEPESSRLARVAPTHWRVDLDPSQPGWRQSFWRASREALAFGAALEVALHLSGDPADQLDQVAAERDRLRPPIRRFLVFHRAEKATSAGWLRLARERLATTVPIAGGTDAYFTELNRERPDLSALDEVVYSVNPQVHAFDNDSLVENLAAQAETVRSARVFCGDRPLVVSPVTLRPRHNPNAADPADRGGPPPDPRQGSLFGAAWTVGSLKYLAEGGADAVTYYEALGPRGLMPRDDGFQEPEGGRRVYPLYHVLVDATERRHAQVLPVDASDPLAVDGLALRDEHGTRVLLANMGAEPRRARVGPLAGDATVRWLDETTADLALSDPAAYRDAPGEPLPLVDGWADLDLRPYAVARVDATPPRP